MMPDLFIIAADLTIGERLASLLILFFYTALLYGPWIFLMFSIARRKALIPEVRKKRPICELFLWTLGCLVLITIFDIAFQIAGSTSSALFGSGFLKKIVLYSAVSAPVVICYFVLLRSQHRKPSESAESSPESNS